MSWPGVPGSYGNFAARVSGCSNRGDRCVGLTYLVLVVVSARVSGCSNRGDRCVGLTYLVLAVVLLREFQDAVTEATDVPEGSVPLVRQLLHPQQRAIPVVRKRSLKDLEDLQREVTAS